MIFYYSGSYQQPLKIKYNIPQLFSQYNERGHIKKIVEYKKEHPEYTAKIMVDSGSYTAYTKGVVIDIDDYCDFINEIGDYIEVFVAVDEVPNPAAMDYTMAEKTWNNYLYMLKKINPKYRDKLIPVFHYGEDFKWLKNMLEYTHEDGSHIDYIGLAISLEGTRKVRINWANQCRKIILESSNPNVKTHAFGVGVKSVLDHIDVTSTDATSWVKRAAYGMIAINDKTIFISKRHEELCNEKAFYLYSKGAQEAIKEEIKKRGFDFDELQNDGYKRAEFNIIDTIQWVDNLNKEKDHITKVSLGW